MKLGINTYGYIWSTPMADCVRRLHDLGYDDFEVVVNPPHCPLDEGDRRSRRRLASSLRAEGIALRSLNLPSLDTNLASPMARMRAYSVEVFRCGDRPGLGSRDCAARGGARPDESRCCRRRWRSARAGCARASTR